MQIYHDPYATTFQEFSEAEKQSWVSNKFADMVTIVVLLVLHHYMTQKAMIIQVIKRNMIS